MKNPQVVEALVDIERHVDVNSFWVDGIQLWPLVRRDLWISLLSYEDTGDDTSAAAAAPAAPSPGNRRPRGSGKSREAELPRATVRERRLSEALQREVFSTVDRTDVLLLSREQDHTESFTDGVIDRIIDPMVWLARREGLAPLKVTLSKEDRWSGARQAEPSLILPMGRFEEARQRFESPSLRVWPPFSSLHRLRARHETRGIRRLLEAVSWRLGTNPLLESQVLSAVRRLNYFSQCFGALLDTCRPRLVVLGVFFAAEAMALTHACRRRGIPVVDIQHGKQGRYHGLYGHWSAMPQEGYSVLPDIFWNWGEESAAIIRQSLPAGSQRPAPVVGGNCWLGAWKGGTAPTCLPEAEALLRRMAGYERTILLSLQPLPSPIPKHVIAAMKQAPDDWLWLVRLHPHHRDKTPEIEALLAAEGIRSFDVATASRAPLYSLLSRVDAQVTCWSSVAYEALALGKPAILVHPMAKTLYSDYIEQGYFTYCDSPDALLAGLCAAMGKVARLEEEPYIETSAERARETLRFCLAFSAEQAAK